GTARCGKGGMPPRPPPGKQWVLLLSCHEPRPARRAGTAHPAEASQPMSTTADPWFQSLFADRIGGAGYGKDTKIYKFEKIKRAKRAALAAHPERKLLDFGIGENDDMADPLVRDVLRREADRVENRGYADNGIQAFKDAAAGFMKKVFGVTLDPATEVNH